MRLSPWLEWLYFSPWFFSSLPHTIERENGVISSLPFPGSTELRLQTTRNDDRVIEFAWMGPLFMIFSRREETIIEEGRKSETRRNISLRRKEKAFCPFGTFLGITVGKYNVPALEHNKDQLACYFLPVSMNGQDKRSGISKLRAYPCKPGRRRRV